jgi:hypothetical protein|uniref:helix-turn-helix domain-containing protein n=1 Tax=Cephaloticoccus sp. TaxID=1985742 RepID=UPI00404B4048
MNTELPVFGERVNATEIAEIIGCTRQHFTRLCRSGQVPAAYQSKGGHWRVRWTKELASWIAKHWTSGPLPKGEPTISGFYEFTVGVLALRQMKKALVTRIRRAERAQLRLLNKIPKPDCLKSLQPAP